MAITVVPNHKMNETAENTDTEWLYSRHPKCSPPPCPIPEFTGHHFYPFAQLRVKVSAICIPTEPEVDSGL